MKEPYGRLLSNHSKDFHDLRFALIKDSEHGALYSSNEHELAFSAGRYEIAFASIWISDK